jgi:hypothetical protein
MCLLIASSVVISQTAPATSAPVFPADTSGEPAKIEVSEEQVTLTGNLTAAVKIEFIPVTEEARIYYTCATSLFDQGAAMNTIKDRLATFVKEKGSYFYTYQKPDETKFDYEAKKTTYISYVRFLR